MTTAISHQKLSWALPYVPFPVADFNLHSYTIIKHTMSIKAFSELRLSSELLKGRGQF
jgi:hypothetical protein